MYECDIRGACICFSTNYSTVVTETNCAIKTEEILNSAIFVLCRFLQLRNIRETFSKYLRNNFSETDISSAAQLSAN